MDPATELRRVHALRWQDEDAAASYRFRASYPPETFDVLLSLMGASSRNVLEVGCGTGNLARTLAPLVDRVDAVDVSKEMIAAARELPGGNRPNIRWHVARAEEAALTPPYELIVGGDCFHWIDASIAMPRFAGVLAPDAALAVVTLKQSELQSWDAAVLEVIVRHSTGYAPYADMIGDWERAGLFRQLGEETTTPMMFEQPIDDFVAAFHAAASLTRAHIDAQAFDGEVRAVMREHCRDGIVRRPIVATIAWGRPLNPSA